MLMGKARSLLKNGTPFRLLALTTNNSLDWKGLPRTNSLAYYEYS